jgi:hypothetical protein
MCSRSSCITKDLSLQNIYIAVYRAESKKNTSDTFLTTAAASEKSTK